MATGFTADFFSNNRRKLATKLHGGVIVLSGNLQMQRRGDVSYPFEQDANFWYLTGLDHPQLHFIYDGQRDYCWIIVPELTETERIFEGEVDRASLLTRSGANEVILQSQIEETLRHIARRHSTVYTVKPSNTGMVVSNPSAREMNQRLDRIFNSVQSCNSELAGMRAIKQPVELRAIERAVKLTAACFSEVRHNINQYNYEYEVEAQFTYRFRQNNADHAYEPIVASAGNACTLHYIDNDLKLKKNNLVLIDIGARVDGYAADITRTYAYGDLSKRKQELHEALGRTQAAIIEALRPNMPLIELQKIVDNLMGEALVSVGLSANGAVDDVRRYMPHAISHGLGLEVHDPLAGYRVLEPGMVLTVEPGLYVPEESIGIRIEDDIAVTEAGIRNLSAKLSTSW